MGTKSLKTARRTATRPLNGVNIVIKRYRINIDDEWADVINLDVCGEFVRYADIAPLVAKAAMFEWRSVKETVPEPEVDVICYSPKDPLSGYMPNVFIDWFGSKRDCGRNVTHWMPVPQPPYHLLIRARAMEG